MESSIHKMPLIVPEVPEFAWKIESFERLYTQCETLVRSERFLCRIKTVIKEALRKHEEHRMFAEWAWGCIDRESIASAEKIASEPEIERMVAEAREGADENLKRENKKVLEILQCPLASSISEFPKGGIGVLKEIFRQREATRKALMSVEGGKYRDDIVNWWKKIARVEKYLEEMVKDYYILLFYARKIEFLTDRDISMSKCLSRDLNFCFTKICDRAKVPRDVLDSLRVDELLLVTQVGDWLAEEARVDEDQPLAEIPLAVAVIRGSVIPADQTRLGVLHGEERGRSFVRQALQDRYMLTRAQEALQPYREYLTRQGVEEA